MIWLPVFWVKQTKSLISLSALVISAIFFGVFDFPRASDKLRVYLGSSVSVSVIMLLGLLPKTTTWLYMAVGGYGYE